jgi:hypothetical protein
MSSKNRNKNKTRKRRPNKTNNKTYSKKDYNSGDGFLTTVWGPMMWSYLHTMSFNYPVHPTKEDKKHYKEFVENLQYVLPCKYCRINLANNFKESPIQDCHMENRDTFSRYIFNLHETVNKMLKKPSNLTFCQVRDRYENFRSRCTEDPTVFKFLKEEPSEKEKEKGCTEPLYGKKSKCVIKIIPQEDKQATFQMDKKCIKVKALQRTPW